MTDVGDLLTPTLTVSPFDGTTTASLVIFRPDGTTAAGTGEATADGGATWTADDVTLNQAGMWVFAWTVTGTGQGVEYSTEVVNLAPTAVPFTAADLLATPQDLAALLQLDYDSLTGSQRDTLTMLVELATAKVQRAAGGQRIVEVTNSDVLIDVTDPCDLYLALPQLPVQSVDEVQLDGVVITDWFLRSQMLWRAGGWMRSYNPPSQVTATWTSGYPAGSQWLQLGKDMTLSLARLGWGSPTGATSEAIDDYRVTYAEADARMQVTDFMAAAIAGAYGASAYVTLSRT